MAACPGILDRPFHEVQLSSCLPAREESIIATRGRVNREAASHKVADHADVVQIAAIKTAPETLAGARNDCAVMAKLSPI